MSRLSKQNQILDEYDSPLSMRTRNSRKTKPITATTVAHETRNATRLKQKTPFPRKSARYAKIKKKNSVKPTVQNQSKETLA